MPLRLGNNAGSNRSRLLVPIFWGPAVADGGGKTTYTNPNIERVKCKARVLKHTSLCLSSGIPFLERHVDKRRDRCIPSAARKAIRRTAIHANKISSWRGRRRDRLGLLLSRGLNFGVPRVREQYDGPDDVQAARGMSGQSWVLLWQCVEQLLDVW